MRNEHLYIDSEGVEYVPIDCPDANLNSDESDRCEGCAFNLRCRTEDCMQCMCSEMREDEREVIWVRQKPKAPPAPEKDPNPL